jgi:hypothetical protein
MTRCAKQEPTLCFTFRLGRQIGGIYRQRGIVGRALRGVEEFTPHHLHSGLLIGWADEEVFAIIGTDRD